MEEGASLFPEGKCLDDIPLVEDGKKGLCADGGPGPVQHAGRRVCGLFSSLPSLQRAVS